MGTWVEKDDDGRKQGRNAIATILIAQISTPDSHSVQYQSRRVSYNKLIYSVHDLKAFSVLNLTQEV